MFIMSYMGDHVWLMTSRQTDPDLFYSRLLVIHSVFAHLRDSCFDSDAQVVYVSSR